MFDVAPGALHRVADHSARVVVSRKPEAGREAHRDDDLAVDRVDLEVLEVDLVAVGGEGHPRRRIGLDVCGHDLLVSNGHLTLPSGVGHDPGDLEGKRICPGVQTTRVWTTSCHLQEHLDWTATAISVGARSRGDRKS